MSNSDASHRFTSLPDRDTMEATIVALKDHGFSVEVVEDLGTARESVLARIPKGKLVMTNTSETLQQTGIADAINQGGHYESARVSEVRAEFRDPGQGN